MTTLTQRSSALPRPLLWALAALSLGAAGGVVATGGLRAAVPVAALAVGAVVAALVLWRIELGLLLIVAVLPLDVFGRIIEEPVTVTFFHFALLITLASWMVHLARGTAPRPRFSALDGALALLILAAVWSLPNSADPDATLFSVIRLTALCAFAVLFENTVVTEGALVRILKLLTWLSVPMAVLATAQSFFGIGVGSFLGYGSITRAGAFFEDPNFLGGYLTVALAISAAYVVHARDWGSALVWALPAPFIAVGLYATYSRSAWVGAVVALAVVVLTAPHARRWWLVALSALLIAAVVAYAPGLIIDRFTSSANITTDRSVATRYYMNQSMLAMIADEPVWGTGLDAFKDVYPDYRRPGSIITIIEPHQLPLALVAEMGVAGLLAEVVLVFALAVTFFWRRRPAGFTVYEAAVLAGLVALLTQTLFQYYLYFEYLWLFLALAVIANRVAASSRLEVS